MFVALFSSRALPIQWLGATREKCRGIFFAAGTRIRAGLWCTNYAVGGLFASIIASFVAERFDGATLLYSCGSVDGRLILFYWDNATALKMWAAACGELSS